MTAIPLEAYMLLSIVIFGLGLFGIVVRRNLVTVLMSTELALNAVNIAFVGIDAHLSLANGQIFALFIIALAAAEAAVGLGIIISIFRLRRVESTDEITDMRG
ncbi:MAG: NADH-quinone oxidoreductase subunit NuoK [Hydrogenobacter thermophilus]|uniref:NADH-quinone oxidoreductase subunit K n=1 Tax=Hydrogenobacter thermophilus (strain DSM 6534 / IAM 12695 / TK-6) TaxID=608538 RepID=D3DGC1_HYDTT|nr:NADH-quinone oxidoreductase subunit NuoK [Hydrogenobacter thermophilus]ADO44809.1 NADH-ubiquinone oxidoreductase chain 4L [Hydrogenobacter thermophilus TK-6]QWK20153.1 MAG: NADH-quinone oxidoreductase subunit NuoK [Hydrogenobacter thermophilus]BAI68873.1 NADH dehydrogenase chain K [Hydrogenobacter thermophilus TK-6]GBC87919.1 NADH-quinone oxidoreductase subunit K [bacterium HR13]